MTSRSQNIHSDIFCNFNEYGSSCLLINLHAGVAKLEIGRGGSSTSSWVWMTDSLSPYPPSPYHCFPYFGFTTTTSLDLLFPFIEQPLSISQFAIILFSFRSFQFFQHHFTLLLAFKFSSLSLYISIIHIIASSSFQIFYHQFTLLHFALVTRNSCDSLFYISILHIIFFFFVFEFVASLYSLPVIYNSWDIISSKDSTNAGSEILVWG